MWRQPSKATAADAMTLLVAARLKDPPHKVWDVEPDRIFYVGQSGKARVAIVHSSGACAIVRSVYPGWPA